MNAHETGKRADPAIATFLALGLSLASVFAGAVFGVLAALGMGLGFMAETAAFFGAGGGLLLSPLLVWALWIGHRVIGGVLVIVPTAITAWVVGVLTPTNGSPFSSMLASVVVYATACLFVGARARIRDIDEEAESGLRCHTCGYDKTGLAGPICPECGSQFEEMR